MIDQRFLDDLAKDLVIAQPEQPQEMLLASSGQTMTDGGAFVGTRLNMPKGLTTRERQAQQSVEIADTLAGGAKGMVQGFAGLPGDLESIGRMALQVLGYDVSGETKLPTSEDIGKRLEALVGPVVPEGQTTVVPTEQRQRMAKGGETGGEILAPGGQLALAGKVAKPVLGATKKIIEAGKDLPVGMSIKPVGEGVDPLGFYSAASQAVDAIKQEKGTGAQFLAQIEKTPGVKKEELLWTGLDEFLKGKKSVTKTEVQDYLNANRVEVSEVTLSDGALRKKFSVNSPDDQDYYDVIDKQGKVIFTGPEDDADYLIDRSMTKFAKYTLPGGSNYREVLLTLPDTRSGSTKVSDANIGQKSFESNEFKSGHFDQPNILAHMRLNDRVDVDGKKVLFVEEVQSDWHQAGRKNKYETPESKAKNAEIESQLGKLSVEKAMLRDQRDAVQKANISNFAFNEDWLRLDKQISDIEKQQTKLRESIVIGVPDAPFKTSWHELALKRAIQLAAEGGYDRIAFTTGKTQAERYDLSKQVDSITSVKEGDGFRIFARDNTGKNTDMGLFAKDKLPDVVGKDLADKISNQTKATDIYEGADLQVGGEGMKGFYDTILPKYLDKYGKKWDAKTGMTKIRLETDAQAAEDANLLRELGVESDGKSAASVHYMDITPKMKESVLTKGQPLFQVAPAIPAGMAAGQQEENK